ncbi:MAG TPA: hypothetical protein VF950_30830 [Planctomycetota bacterium]
MRYSTQDPAAELRKGLVFVVVGGLVLVGVVLGLLLAGGQGVSKRILASGIAGGVFAAAFVLVGCLSLRDAAALRRERRLFGPRPPVEARVKFRPKGKAVEPNPDLLPPFPTRRMIGVTVMFAGLILPILFGAFAAGIGPAIALVPMASWLIFNVVSLWKGQLWAWKPAVAVFLMGFVGGLIPLIVCGLTGELQGILWAGALTAHFGVGLLALFSLRPWLNYLEWKPARDALATADKPAVLAALRALKR